MSRSNFSDALTLLERQREAANQAMEELESLGVKYPYCDSNLSAYENYGRLLAYFEQHSARVVEIMGRVAGGEKVIPLESLETKKPWRDFNDKDN